MQNLIDCGDHTKKNIKEHNSNWLQILDYTYRILITTDSELRKQIYYLI